MLSHIKRRRVNFDQRITIYAVASASEATLDAYGFETVLSDQVDGERTAKATRIPASIDKWESRADAFRGAQPETLTEYVVIIRHPGTTFTVDYGDQIDWHNQGDRTLYVVGIPVGTRREGILEVPCSTRRGT